MKKNDGDNNNSDDNLVPFLLNSKNRESDILRIMFLIETDNVHLLTDEQIARLPLKTIIEITKISNSVLFKERVQKTLFSETKKSC